MSPYSSDTATLAALRRLKLLMAVLVLSNCALGVFSVYLLNRLDRDYSVLIDETLPLMGGIRAVARAQTDAYRAIVAGAVARDPKLCAEAAQRARREIGRAHTARLQLAQSEILRQKPEALRELNGSGAELEAMADELIPKISTPDAGADEPARLPRLDAVLERCRGINRQLLEYVDARGQRINDDFSAGVRHRSALVLGLAGWPLLLAVAVALVVGVVLLGMVVIFRRIGAED